MSNEVENIFDLMMKGAMVLDNGSSNCKVMMRKGQMGIVRNLMDFISFYYEVSDD